MMRFWMESYARRHSAKAETAISSIAHAIVIAAWVLATLPTTQVAPDSIANRVFYIPPPDKIPGGPERHESVHFVTLPTHGLGEAAGQGPRLAGNAAPTPTDESIGRLQRDTVVDPTPATAVQPPSTGKEDSIFTVLDVDTAVVRSTNSAAPAYPLKLLEAHVTGSVSARYVVDTTGFADTASFTVVKATNAGFSDAVRDALPYMRFRPAKIGPIKVRQLVEQTFTFKITGDTVVAAPRGKKPDGGPSLRTG